MYRAEILKLDGSPWLWNVLAPTGHWKWVTEQMIHHFQCDYADVETMETEEHGDVVLVRDQAVGLLRPLKRATDPTEQPSAIPTLDAFMLSVLETQDDPAKIMSARDTWRAARKSAEQREKAA